MEKSEQRKLASKIVDAANQIVVRKGKTFMPAGYIYVPWVPVAGVYPYVRKKIMFVREWLAAKKTKEQRKEYGIDAEAELTKMLTEELARELEKQREKTVNQSWINKNIRGLD